MIRAADLNHFLLTLRAAVADAAGDADSGRFAERVFTALETAVPAGPSSGGRGTDGRLDRAFANAARTPGGVARVAGALRAMERRLAWAPRLGSEDDPAFRDAHLNAVLVGEGGLEPRSDVGVGVSWIEAGGSYVEHDHPPEEIYYALSEGEWFQRGPGWRRVSPGDIVHNPPGIRHNMRAGAEPLLAVWCLWTAAG